MAANEGRGRRGGRKGKDGQADKDVYWSVAGRDRSMQHACHINSWDWPRSKWAESAPPPPPPPPPPRCSLAHGSPSRLTGLALLLTGGTEPELERLIQRGICGGCEGFKGTSEIARRRLSNVFQRLIDDDWLDGEREDRSARYYLPRLWKVSRRLIDWVCDGMVVRLFECLFFFFFGKRIGFFSYHLQSGSRFIYLLIMDVERVRKSWN